MASTNKTANLRLNQWVATDPVLMADFNADNQKLDAAVAAAQAAANAAGNCKIYTGSYVGTGVYGINNKNTLSFSFDPKMVFIARVDAGSEMAVFYPLAIAGRDPGWYRTAFDATNNSNAKARYDTATHTLSWYYAGTDTKYQLNASGSTYYWYAFV